MPTVFNFLGPLCNPARAEANAVGVAQLDRVPLITGVFRTRGATALVFRGDDGLDELTTTGHSRVWEVSRGDIHEHDLDPRDLGIPLAQIDDLLGGDPQHNAAVVHRVFAGEPGAVRDIVLLNAAAGIVSFRLSQDAAQVQRPDSRAPRRGEGCRGRRDRQRRGDPHAQRLGRGDPLLRGLSAARARPAESGPRRSREHRALPYARTLRAASVRAQSHNRRRIP